MEWTFSTLLWSTLVFYFWFTIIWMFIAVFASIIRADMSGWMKAAWIVLVAVLPFLGALMYLVAKPPSAELNGLSVWDPTSRRRSTHHRTTDEIAQAAQLYEQGRISSTEYQHMKEQALSR